MIIPDIFRAADVELAEVGVNLAILHPEVFLDIVGHTSRENGQQELLLQKIMMCMWLVPQARNSPVALVTRRLMEMTCLLFSLLVSRFVLTFFSSLRNASLICL